MVIYDSDSIWRDTTLVIYTQLTAHIQNGNAVTTTCVTFTTVLTATAMRVLEC